MSKISFENSLDIIDKILFDDISSVKVSLIESLGRVLSIDIEASENYPAKPTSAMDGYAIKYEDMDERLEVLCDNPAGHESKDIVAQKTAIKIFTGSLVPDGSDTVVPIENIQSSGKYISIVQKVPKGFSIRKVGESYKDGELLIKKGVKIGFSEIGVMASLNISSVEVYVKPIVAVASTGDEILDIGQKQTSPSQIRGTNHITMEAMARLHGSDVLQLGIIKDDKTAIKNMYKTALNKADIVVTTGGVSVGDYDFVKDIIKFELGADVLFHGVAIKPGQHIAVAKLGSKVIIGLPGFAYSSTVTFLLYVVPLIYKLQGIKYELEPINAKTLSNIPATNDKAVWTACDIRNTQGNLEVSIEDKKQGTSAILNNLVGDTCLLYQKPNTPAIKKGDTVQVVQI